MQRIKNYGSFLQAYALKNLLTDLGHEVEFVDYHIGEPLVPGEASLGLLRKLDKAVDAIRIGAGIGPTIGYLFYKKNYAKKYFPLLGIDEYNYNPKLDCLVIGSDEVFNCIQSNPNVGYSLELFGKDNNAKKVITYAASFGNTTEKLLRQYHRYDEIKGLLQQIEQPISVRDLNSSSIIGGMGLTSDIYLDPVLSYDWKKSLVDIQPMKWKKPYLLIYGYSGRFSRAECKEIRAYARSKHLKIINIGGIQRCCDKFISCTPMELFSWFLGAEEVVTDTFHGSILSILTKRPFVTYVRQSGYGNMEKIVDLLTRLKLDGRISTSNHLNAIMQLPIDWKAADKIIREYRQKTQEYFNTKLDG